MVRGTQKQIIHLKNPESPLFEEAFLIVKHFPRASGTSRTMVEEANRLLTEQYAADMTRRPARKSRRFGMALLCFFSGALTSAAILMLCLLL